MSDVIHLPDETRDEILSGTPSSSPSTYGINQYGSYKIQKDVLSTIRSTNLPNPLPIPPYSDEVLNARKFGKVKNHRSAIIRETVKFFMNIKYWWTSEDYDRIAQMVSNEFPDLRDTVSWNSQQMVSNEFSDLPDIVSWNSQPSYVKIRSDLSMCARNLRRVAKNQGMRQIKTPDDAPRLVELGPPPRNKQHQVVETPVSFDKLISELQQELAQNAHIPGDMHQGTGMEKSSRPTLPSVAHVLGKRFTSPSHQMCLQTSSSFTVHHNLLQSPLLGMSSPHMTSIAQSMSAIMGGASLYTTPPLSAGDLQPSVFSRNETHISSSLLSGMPQDISGRMSDSLSPLAVSGHTGTPQIKSSRVGQPLPVSTEESECITPRAPFQTKFYTPSSRQSSPDSTPCIQSHHSLSVNPASILPSMSTSSVENSYLSLPRKNQWFDDEQVRELPCPLPTPTFSEKIEKARHTGSIFSVRSQVIRETVIFYMKLKYRWSSSDYDKISNLVIKIFPELEDAVSSPGQSRNKRVRADLSMCARNLRRRDINKRETGFARRPSGRRLFDHHPPEVFEQKENVQDLQTNSMSFCNDLLAAASLLESGNAVQTLCSMSEFGPDSHSSQSDRKDQSDTLQVHISKSAEIVLNDESNQPESVQLTEKNNLVEPEMTDSSSCKSSDSAKNSSAPKELLEPCENFDASSIPGTVDSSNVVKDDEAEIPHGDKRVDVSKADISDVKAELNAEQAEDRQPEDFSGALEIKSDSTKDESQKMEETKDTAIINQGPHFPMVSQILTSTEASLTMNLSKTSLDLTVPGIVNATKRSVWATPREIRKVRSASLVRSQCLPNPLPIPPYSTRVINAKLTGRVVEEKHLIIRETTKFFLSLKYWWTSQDYHRIADLVKEQFPEFTNARRIRTALSLCARNLRRRFLMSGSSTELLPSDHPQRRALESTLNARFAIPTEMYQNVSNHTQGHSSAGNLSMAKSATGTVNVDSKQYSVSEIKSQELVSSPRASSGMRRQQVSYVPGAMLPSPLPVPPYSPMVQQLKTSGRVFDGKHLIIRETTNFYLSMKYYMWTTRDYDRILNMLYAEFPQLKNVDNLRSILSSCVRNSRHKKQTTNAFGRRWLKYQPRQLLGHRNTPSVIHQNNLPSPALPGSSTTHGSNVFSNKVSLPSVIQDFPADGISPIAARHLNSSSTERIRLPISSTPIQSQKHLQYCKSSSEYRKDSSVRTSVLHSPAVVGETSADRMLVESDSCSADSSHLALFQSKHVSLPDPLPVPPFSPRLLRPELVTDAKHNRLQIIRETTKFFLSLKYWWSSRDYDRIAELVVSHFPQLKDTIVEPNMPCYRQVRRDLSMCARNLRRKCIRDKPNTRAWLQGSTFNTKGMEESDTKEFKPFKTDTDMSCMKSETIVRNHRSQGSCFRLSIPEITIPGAIETSSRIPAPRLMIEGDSVVRGQCDPVIETSRAAYGPKEHLRRWSSGENANMQSPQPQNQVSVKPKKVYIDPDHGSKLQQQLSQLWKDRKYLDADLDVNGTKIQAHRLILLASCPFLQTTLDHDDVKTRIEISMPEDASVESVEAFLKYLYDGVLHINSDTVHALRKIASMMQITKLSKYCQDFVDNILKESSSQEGSGNMSRMSFRNQTSCEEHVISPYFSVSSPRSSVVHSPQTTRNLSPRRQSQETFLDTFQTADHRTTVDYVEKMSCKSYQTKSYQESVRSELRNTTQESMHQTGDIHSVNMLRYAESNSFAETSTMRCARSHDPPIKIEINSFNDCSQESPETAANPSMEADARPVLMIRNRSSNVDQLAEQGEQSPTEISAFQILPSNSETEDIPQVQPGSQSVFPEWWPARS